MATILLTHRLLDNALYDPCGGGCRVFGDLRCSIRGLPGGRDAIGRVCSWGAAMLERLLAELFLALTLSHIIISPWICALTLDLCTPHHLTLDLGPVHSDGRDGAQHVDQELAWDGSLKVCAWYLLKGYMR